MVNNSKNGPIYKLADAKKLAQLGKVSVVGKYARNDISDLNWDDTDIATLFDALENRHYKNSHSYKLSDAHTNDCDAYVIHFDYKTMQENKYSQDFYVKFAISPSGTLLLIFSCHYSR